MLDILQYLRPPIVAAVLYAVLGGYFWLTRWPRSGKPIDPAPMQALERMLIAIPLFFHGLSLYGAVFSDGGLRFSFSLAISLTLWLTALIYWLDGFRSHMNGMQPIVLPLAALSAVFPVFFAQTHEIVHTNAWGFKLHFLTAMLAYSLCALSALHAVFMGVIERQLHHKFLTSRQTGLPSILSMETLLFRMIGLAFLLLTLAVISGLLFSEEIFGRALVFNHKTFFALISWGVFAVLLFGHRFYGWRGRTAIRWTLAGFFLLVLAYIGSRFVLEVLLGRI